MTRSTRQAIVEAALSILGREGPDGFSAAALARAVGVSKSTIFHHFASLDEIPLAALDQLWSELMAAQRDPGLSLRETLEALGADVAEMAAEHGPALRAYFAFFAKAMFDPTLRRRLRESADDAHRALVELVTPKLPPSLRRSAPETGRLIALALDGLGLHLLVAVDEAELRAGWALLVELICNLEGSER